MTFSIVARDAASGRVGVATATGGPVVGVLVPHARAGVGAIATQGDTNPLHGVDGLAALERGLSAEEVVAALTGADPGRARRQLIVVDRAGRVAGWSGSELIERVGMRFGDGVAVAGNMLPEEGVAAAMLRAYEGARDEPLDSRLLAALRAGEAAGGDRRGTRSAALRVHDDQPYPALDLRVDFSPAVIADLTALRTEVLTGPYAAFFAGRPRRDEA